MSWINKARDFFKEVKAEYRKVSFPSRQEVMGTTVVVVIASFIMSLYLAFADLVILWAYELVMGKLG